MKRTLTVALALIFASCNQQNSEPKKLDGAEEFTIETLNNTIVVGRLGVPLGHVVEVRARIVDGDNLGVEKFKSRYLLEISSVEDQALDEVKLFTFDWGNPFSDHWLPNDPFKLYLMKHGKENEGSLTGDEVREVEQDYVGTFHTLVVYETARTNGVPQNLPEDIGMSISGKPIRFHTRLEILLCR